MPLFRRRAPPDAPLDAAGVVAVLAAAAARVLPSDELGPGAREARVDRFLAGALADPRLSEVVPLAVAAADALDRGAHAEHGAGFAALDDGAQDALLERLADADHALDGDDGPLHLHVIIMLTLEGMFADPRHGGNAGEVGWRLAGFSPRGRRR